MTAAEKARLGDVRRKTEPAIVPSRQGQKVKCNSGFVLQASVSYYIDAQQISGPGPRSPQLFDEEKQNQEVILGRFLLVEQGLIERQESQERTRN